VDDHFRLWLRAGMTGCEFAKLLAGKTGRVAIELHVDAELPPTDWLNNTFDEHAKADRAVIAVFPMIGNEIALVEFLNALGTDARWKVRRRAKASPTGGVLVGLEWTTRAGDVSERFYSGGETWRGVVLGRFPRIRRAAIRGDVGRNDGRRGLAHVGSARRSQTLSARSVRDSR